jgi:thiol-disulfide isomerase/thioredoxin
VGRRRPAVKLRYPAGVPTLISALLAAAALHVVPLSDAPSLPHLAGEGKPVVLHFWATWCTACRDEFPRIREALTSMPGRNVGVLLVSIDRPALLDRVRQDLRRFKMESLPAVVLDAPQPDPVIQAIGDPAWDGTLPSTFVFDAKGRRVHSFIGRTDAAALQAAVSAATVHK